MLAPIILFVYNRLGHTIKTVEALQKNDLAKECVLYVFCDGPKIDASFNQKEKVLEVQKYSRTISGFKEIHVEISNKNKGLANSVISGVTKIINQYGKVIVVEDDIVTNRFFLRYMNNCLDVYNDRQDIFMIGGYNYNFKIPKDYKNDVYVVHRSCTWGWATWKNRWNKADWDVRDYDVMCKDRYLQNRFNRGGADMFLMLKSQMSGEIDSWGIRWDYSMFKHDGLCVHPVKGFCYNNGMDGSGVHCGDINGTFSAPLFKSVDYQININQNVKIDSVIEKRFARFQEYGGNDAYHYYKNVLVGKLGAIIVRIKKQLFR